MEGSFLEKASELILSQFPTYRPWAEALSLYMLANAHPHSHIEGGGPGLPITFNPWIIGPSRFSFKSTPLDYVVKPILDEVGINIIPARMTVEGMYSFVKETGVTTGALIRDETSGLVAETRKNYLSDELTFLSRMLDGWIDPRLTVKKGLFELTPVRINFTSACTPQIFGILEEDFWTQGLGNKLIPIYVTESVMEEYAIPFSAEEDEGSSKVFSEKLDAVIDLLKKHVSTDVEYVNIPNDISRRFKATEFQDRREAYKKYFSDKWNIVPSYEYECNVQIKRVAALKAIDRQVGVRVPVMDREDYDWAVKWIGDRFKEFLLIFSDWKFKREEFRLRTGLFTLEERIIVKLKENNGKFSRTYLNNNIPGDSGTKNRIIEELMKSGRVVFKVEETGGRKRGMFVLQEEEW